jgi:fatty acid CoA ligase FadD36
VARVLTGLTDGALDRPDAIEVAGHGMSGPDLLAAAGAVAAEICGAGTVAIHATAGLETVVAVVGALTSGVTFVPMPPDSGVDERAHLLSDSGASLVLSADPSLAETVSVPVVPLDVSRRAEPPSVPPDDGRPAMIMYTSGTTGLPKGVMLSRYALAAGIDGLVDAWDWTRDDVLVHGLPLFHVHGLVLGLLGPLRVGSRLRHTGRPRPDLYAAAAGSMYFGVPTVWSRICAEPDAARALSGARLLVSGSAPLPVPVFEAIEKLTGHRPVERYGMTETLITVSTRADGERRPGHVGFPLAGVATRLVHEDGSAVPCDGTSIGELQITGPMLSDGYWRRPDATEASRTPDGWFRTGDIASIDPDGWHRIVGRASTDLIKTGGYRVGAGEVEDALLAPHKRPRTVHFLFELPRNAMGKVMKKELNP